MPQPSLFPVALVGAGPGDPELLTLKALRLLEQADVVVYDRLVSDDVLARIPATVEKIFAGKMAYNHYMSQDTINALLVSLAREGRRVVRLKGGDPFVFGRGGEEAMYLVQHAIPYEVVPGITSSAACSAYAGVPLTHRDMAHSVHFVTGHTQRNADSTATEPDLNWQSLANPDMTLVIYMGITNVESIAQRLIEAGLAPTTPAMAINNGTRTNQRSLSATLATLPQVVRTANLAGPTLMVIGQVVSLAEELQWFHPDDTE